jgi:hypothetical protein
LSSTPIRVRSLWDWGGLTALQLVARTYREIDRHDTVDRAAVVAFYALLSLVPLLGFVLAVAFGPTRGDRARHALLQRRLPRRPRVQVTGRTPCTHW